MSNDFFEIRDSEINIEDIMNEIRKNIKERNMGNVEFPEFADMISKDQPSAVNSTFNMSEFMQSIADINSLYNIQTDAPIRSHRKGIGSLVVFFKKALRKSLRWYINPPFDMQREFNYNVTNNMNQLTSFMTQLNAFVLESRHKLDEVDNMLVRLHNAELNLQDLNRTTKTTANTNMVVGDRLRRIERSIKEAEVSVEQSTTTEVTPQDSSNKNADFDIDYLMFERLYRGTNEEIAKRQDLYLSYFKDKQNVLDIGCGSGEFVEILLKNGVNAKGIDLNNDMVYHCQEKNLPVEKADAIKYLDKLEDDSLDGIFMAQVIEHIKPGQLLKLVQLAQRKLKKDGLIIMETINPQCLSVFSNSFYLDMTHEKPVHPFAIKFILESTGFSSTDLIYLSEIKEKLPAIKSSEIQNLEEINAGFERLNKLLFGAQDYAIIARK